MSDKKSAILQSWRRVLTENYASEELFMPKSGRRLPNRSVIIDIVRDLKSIVFPGYFSTDTSAIRVSGVLCGTQTERSL